MNERRQTGSARIDLRRDRRQPLDKLRLVSVRVLDSPACRLELALRLPALGRDIALSGRANRFAREADLRLQALAFSLGQVLLGVQTRVLLLDIGQVLLDLPHTLT